MKVPLGMHTFIQMSINVWSRNVDVKDDIAEGRFSVGGEVGAGLVVFKPNGQKAKAVTTRTQTGLPRKISKDYFRAELCPKLSNKYA